MKFNKQDLYNTVVDLINVGFNFYGMCANPGDVIYFLKFAWNLYIFTYKFYDRFLKD